MNRGDKMNIIIERARKCPKCGSYDTVGYEGIYGCQDCDCQFPDPLKEREE